MPALGFLVLDDLLDRVKLLEARAHPLFLRVRLHPLAQDLFGGFDLGQSPRTQHQLCGALSGFVDIALNL